MVASRCGCLRAAVGHVCQPDREVRRHAQGASLGPGGATLCNSIALIHSVQFGGVTACNRTALTAWVVPSPFRLFRFFRLFHLFHPQEVFPESETTMSAQRMNYM